MAVCRRKPTESLRRLGRGCGPGYAHADSTPDRRGRRSFDTYNAANELLHEVTPGVETAYYPYDGRGNQTQRSVLGGETTQPAFLTRSGRQWLLLASSGGLRASRPRRIHKGYACGSSRVRPCLRRECAHWARADCLRAGLLLDAIARSFQEAQGSRPDLVRNAGSSYNSRNLVTRIDSTQEGFTPNTFGYNALGQRIRIIDSTGTKWYVWDGLDILLEHDGAGTLIRRYTHGHTAIPGVGSLIAVEDAEGNVYFYHLDPLGGIHRLTDIAQAIAKLYEFGPFGRMLQETGSAPNEFVFPANTLAVLPLGRLRLGVLRALDCHAARWTTRDIVRLSHRYVFAGSNPQAFADPTSLDPQDILNHPFVTGEGFAGIVGGILEEEKKKAAQQQFMADMWGPPPKPAPAPPPVETAQFIVSPLGDQFTVFWCYCAKFRRDMSFWTGDRVYAIATDSLAKAVEMIEYRLKELGPCACIERLEFWAHGSAGQFRVGPVRGRPSYDFGFVSDHWWREGAVLVGKPTQEGDKIELADLKGKGKHYANMKWLADRMCPGGTVYFRSCQTFAHTSGKLLLEEARKLFKGCRILGHTELNYGFTKADVDICPVPCPR